MTLKDSEFWRNKKYHELAREYEQNIERIHPSRVSGRAHCSFCHHCAFAASAITYYEYRGPRV